MKKILLILPYAYGYEDYVIENLRKNNYQVIIFDIKKEKYRKARKIKNPFLRLYNDKYLKKYKNINIKDELEAKVINEDLLNLNESFDFFIKIGPVFLQEKTLKILKKISKILISHHWDSIKVFSRADIALEKKYFNKVSTYDKTEALYYKINYLPNFYAERLQENIVEKIENDIYTIMSSIKEKEFLEKIKIECEKNNINANLNLFNIKDVKNIESKIINILKKGISVKEMLDKCKKSKCILEINRKNYNGYTMRTFDAIGLKKKLITTNKNIVNEDFYCPNNILVIDENNINISKEFIDSPYEELPKEIYEKYSLENWVKQLMNVEK